MILRILVVALLVAAPPPTSGDWSISAIPGHPLSQPATATLAPGASVDGEFLISHTDAIDGPVDVTATTTRPVSDLANHLLVTTSLAGEPGQTVTLAALLLGGAVRAGNALPNGPVVLRVRVTLDPALTTDKLREAAFTLFVTVSDEVRELPGQGGRPAGALASGGLGVPIFAIVEGVALMAVGLVLVLLRRRRKDPPPEVHIAS